MGLKLFEFHILILECLRIRLFCLSFWRTSNETIPALWADIEDILLLATKQAKLPFGDRTIESKYEFIAMIFLTKTPLIL